MAARNIARLRTSNPAMSPRFCRRHVIGPGVALLIFSAVGTFAADSVANAPTVPPAPTVDKPLAPAANDVPGDQPSPQHVWVPGHWRWSEGAYVWETGRWEIPPAANVTWQAPTWEKQANGYVLREGFWGEAPPPVTVAQPSTPPPAEVVVTTAPPPVQREIIVERPTLMHVWMPGYWTWRHGRYEWVQGRWVTPPRTNVVWVPARWEHRGGRYVFIDGYWRDAVVVTPPPPGTTTIVTAPPPTPGQQQVVVVAPPAPRVEVVYARPSPYHIWVPGYWAWRGGRHVWIAGRYELPPRGRQAWVEPRWERRSGSYIFIEGHWR